MPSKTHQALLEAATGGYLGHPCPENMAAPARRAWNAGQALAKSGRTAPDVCRPARGNCMHIETTGGMTLLARYDRATGEVTSLERMP